MSFLDSLIKSSFNSTRVTVKCMTCGIDFLDVIYSDFLTKSRFMWKSTRPELSGKDIPIDRWMGEVVKHHLENKDHSIILQLPHMSPIDLGEYWRNRFVNGYDPIKLDAMIHEGDDAEI